MSISAKVLSPSEAARALGVSVKALRLYEHRGLVVPIRSAAGWRAYGPGEMARLSEIVALRALGLSVAQIAQVFGGAPLGLEPALAAHQVALEVRGRQIAEAIAKVRAMRNEIARGERPSIGDLASLLQPSERAETAFTLPWPWGGERFELRDIKPLTYITGPLGSGKTRFAHRLTEALPNAAFLGLDRLNDDGAVARAVLELYPALGKRIDDTVARLVDAGATASPALFALLLALEADAPAILVIDMIEQGLDHATQEALIAYLRRRGPAGRPLFLLTRSSAILDLAAMRQDEAIVLCPANHSPPSRVAPYPGTPGYEAVATCLASPVVRARTEGVIAWRPQSA